ncbi:MAG: ABC transporter permease subunit [Firmicutes bacterium]|nr:ABC transporter permease subunit [Bacillota bacterium]
MIAVLKRELKTYFLTPTGYIFMGFFLLISGFFFAIGNLFSANPNYNSMLGTINFVFMILVPILTMRLLAEESRQKTDQLLLTSPLSVTEIVLGKYLAAVAVFLLTVAVTCIYPIILSFFGSIAVSEIVGGYLGFILLGSSFIAVGLFISSLTENQVVAAVVTFSALLLFWIIDVLQQVLPNDTTSGIIFTGLIVAGVVFLIYRSIKNYFLTVISALVGIGGITAGYFINKQIYDGIILRFIDWISLLKRFEPFWRGNLSLSPIVFFLSFIALFIFLTIQMIEKRRWN